MPHHTCHTRHANHAANFCTQCPHQPLPFWCPLPLQLDAIALSPTLDWEMGQARSYGSSSPTKRTCAHSSSCSCSCSHSHSPPRHRRRRYASPEHTSRDSNTQGRRSRHAIVEKARTKALTLHFFKGAQQCVAPPLVPYVLGAMSTSMPNAPHPSFGMEERSVCEEMSKDSLSSSMASQSVSISKPWQGAQTLPTPHNTYVQGAGSQDMAPSSVLRHRRANPLTPYKPSAWHSWLD